MGNIHHLKLIDCEEEGNDKVVSALSEAIARQPSEVVVIGIADGKFFLESSDHSSTVNLVTVALHRLAHTMAEELA